MSADSIQIVECSLLDACETLPCSVTDIRLVEEAGYGTKMLTCSNYLVTMFLVFKMEKIYHVNYCKK